MKVRPKIWDVHSEDDNLAWVLARVVDAEKGIVEIDENPIEFTGVTIQESGYFDAPHGVTLDAMTDPSTDQCTFTITSFAATETQAREQLDDFLKLLIVKITPS